MCGINGVFDPGQRLPDKAAPVRHMDSQMIYRGPDDEGLYSDDQIALGMRRLSIIDVSGGHQPLFNEDRSLVIVVNGEIYNYVELMRDLKARGHVFTTASDGETILHLYEDKGVDCLADLRGMFAFILWDRKQRRVFAARDRVGIKPLYFAEHNGALWLSSELKAIVKAGRMAPTLRATAVYQFLLYGYPVDQRHTVVEQIKRVLPGEYLLATETGTTFHRYWEPQFGGDQGITDLPDEEILNRLQTAVSLHLRSDVPVGILLSGGIDSSVIAALAVQHSDHLAALCAGYAGNHAVDERPVAHATARQLHLKVIDVVLDQNEYKNEFSNLARYCDEPVGDTAAAPQWQIYRQARGNGFKVVLSGIGGDEVFFGYPRWNTIGEQTRGLSSAEFKDWNGLGQEPSQRILRRQVETLGGSSFAGLSSGVEDPLFAVRTQVPQGPDAMGAQLFGTYLVHNGCLLADKLGMGCSVEVRVPLLDHVLVQAVFALPLARRFSPRTNKILLRRLFGGSLPAAIFEGDKRGFTPPLDYVKHLLHTSADEILGGILCSQALLQPRELQRWLRPTGWRSWLASRTTRSTENLARIRLQYRILALEKWYEHVCRVQDPI